ncbi:hypothetical protein AAMO2058_001609200 [Amorphochlora amoebiformis]
MESIRSMSDNLNVKCTRRTYEVGSEEDWEMKISSYRGRGSRMAREPHHRVQASDLEDLLNADNPVQMVRKGQRSHENSPKSSPISREEKKSKSYPFLDGERQEREKKLRLQLKHITEKLHSKNLRNGRESFLKFQMRDIHKQMERVQSGDPTGRREDGYLSALLRQNGEGVSSLQRLQVVIKHMAHLHSLVSEELTWLVDKTGKDSGEDAMPSVRKFWDGMIQVLAKMGKSHEEAAITLEKLLPEVDSQEEKMSCRLDAVSEQYESSEKTILRLQEDAQETVASATSGNKDARNKYKEIVSYHNKTLNIHQAKTNEWTRILEDQELSRMDLLTDRMREISKTEKDLAESVAAFSISLPMQKLLKSKQLSLLRKDLSSFSKMFKNRRKKKLPDKPEAFAENWEAYSPKSPTGNSLMLPSPFKSHHRRSAPNLMELPHPTPDSKYKRGTINLQRLGTVEGDSEFDVKDDELDEMSPTQILKNLTLYDVISDPVGVKYFSSHLRQEFSHENIVFWIAVENFKKKWLGTNEYSAEKLASTAQLLYQQFFTGSSLMELNISSTTRNALEKNFEKNQVTIYMFDQAQNDIYKLMNHDSFPR